MLLDSVPRLVFTNLTSEKVTHCLSPNINKYLLRKQQWDSLGGLVSDVNEDYSMSNYYKWITTGIIDIYLGHNQI